MHKRWVLITLVYFFANAFAEPCSISMADLSKELQAANKTEVRTIDGLTDIYSSEPIRRYIQAMADGSIIIVEQKHCRMYNLTVSMLLPEDYPIDNIPDRFSNTLSQTVIWRRWFKTLDATKILKNDFASKPFLSQPTQIGNFIYSLDNKIKSKDENSEAILRVVNLEAGTLPFQRIISIYLGVGGL